MPGFDHVAPTSQENETASPRRIVYGRILFYLYLLFYGGFVLLNAFYPSLMEVTPFAGINLAILYGLALIAIAFVFALLYDWLCRMLDTPTKKNEEAGS